MVFVPSLWSAPIEGALVKSIVAAQRVAVIDIANHFQQELPDGLVLRLSAELDLAASQLREAIATEWKPDPELKKQWIDRFRAENEKFAERVLQTIAAH
jgi:hypothetical protein